MVDILDTAVITADVRLVAQFGDPIVGHIRELDAVLVCPCTTRAEHTFFVRYLIIFMLFSSLFWAAHSPLPRARCCYCRRRQCHRGSR